MNSREITKEEVEALAKELAEKKKPKIIGRRITREHTVYDFPIKVDVTSYGVTTTKKLEKGSVVPCWKCGEHFRVNSKSAFEFEEQFYLHCPKCESDVSVLYYFGKELVRRKLF